MGYRIVLDINYFYNMTSAGLNIVSFNIYGFKSSYPTMDPLLEEGTDIVFTCEHWLKTAELFTTKCRYMDLNYYPHIECSIDCDHISAGPSYGGLGWICKRIISVPYTVIECDSDRVSGLHVIQNGCVMLNIIGVYLLPNNGSAQQIQSMGKPYKYCKEF